MKLLLCDDVEEITKYEKLIFSSLWTTQQWKDWLASSFNCCYFICQLDVYGFLAITCLPQESTCEVIRVGVLPAFRKRNIALQAFQVWFAMLPQMYRVFLEVDEKNVAAIRLYQKLGFKKIHIRKNYYQNNNAAIVMKKIIDNDQ